MFEGDKELPIEGKDSKVDTKDTTIQRLESIDKTLRELLTWTRFANIPRLTEILERELDNDQKKLAYENSDGTNGQKEVSALSGAPISTIGKWWPNWFNLGLVTESETRKGRMKKVVSLEDVGIAIPKKKASSASAGTPSPQTTIVLSVQDSQESGGNP